VPDGLLAAAGLQPPFTVPLEVWSLFANVLNYLFVGALFAVEYVAPAPLSQRGYRNFSISHGGWCGSARCSARPARVRRTSVDAGGQGLGCSGSSSPPIVPTPAARAKAVSASARLVVQKPRSRSRPSLNR
jgi:hypothetical protein